MLPLPPPRVAVTVAAGDGDGGADVAKKRLALALSDDATLRQEQPEILGASDEGGGGGAVDGGGGDDGDDDDYDCEDDGFVCEQTWDGLRFCPVVGRRFSLLQRREAELERLEGLPSLAPGEIGWLGLMHDLASRIYDAAGELTGNEGHFECVCEAAGFAKGILGRAERLAGVPCGARPGGPRRPR